MSIIDLFHESPVLTSFLTLVYSGIWCVFLYLMYQLYKKR